MSNLYVIAEDREAAEELCQGLTRAGHTCSIASAAGVAAWPAAPDLVLLESGSYPRIAETSRRLKGERDLPVIALLHAVPENASLRLESVDDFVVKPWELNELELRVRRRLRPPNDVTGSEVIRYGDLVIDVSRYEIFVAGRPATLTFKEYELLKFLASNPDRVFTREALLNKVWGYDYYGGDRTVDVHVQRLRSKIEGSKHVVIETVRNIGYRLRANKC